MSPPLTGYVIDFTSPFSFVIFYFLLALLTHFPFHQVFKIFFSIFFTSLQIFYFSSAFLNFSSALLYLFPSSVSSTLHQQFMFGFSSAFFYFPPIFFFKLFFPSVNPLQFSVLFPLFKRDLNRGCLVYMFSLRFSGSKYLINLRRQFRGRKIFSCT